MSAAYCPYVLTSLILSVHTLPINLSSGASAFPCAGIPMSLHSVCFHFGKKPQLMFLRFSDSLKRLPESLFTDKININVTVVACDIHGFFTSVFR